MSKYGEILAGLERQLADGAIRPGEKLPSVRNAAMQQGCSVSTVLRAYSELEKRHLIYSIPQSGYFAVGRTGNGQAGESSLIDFSSVLPDTELFPYRDFQHCLNKAIDTYQHELFQYGSVRGLDSLRRTLVSHLAGDGVYASPDSIFVTAGVKPVLDLLARMPFPNGKNAVIVEQPTFDLYLRFLEAEGIPVRGVPRGESGLDLAELEKQFKRGDVKLFYTMSRYHNPLGTSLNDEQKRKIAKLAAKYDVYVAEDDYMADLGEARGFKPIHGFDRTRVIYLKSFSKSIFPGLRIGLAVLPEQLEAIFLERLAYSSCSLLSQAALDIYMRSGMYDRHKSRIGSRYAARMNDMNEAVKAIHQSGELRLPSSGSGIYIALRLPQAVNLDRLEARLAAQGIKVRTGPDFYLAGWLERDKFLRLSISRTGTEQIQNGVRRIAEAAAVRDM
ncbi:PLP-dependent aminotransferase family protein [Paenibacillus pasadenensis]|uniref:aminotransferase-like domain-containing protein n=1 Tax=Paenibacillus pasadenensis TaxID=217090 RepID=UPI00204017D7|nr:PLP-dependent aminotransferase family protein [Paenibacillus pasadenensis]MCM3747070.1 PLP-dependent aminotransferase family protein [Paenibacillus pasadenensis]